MSDEPSKAEQVARGLHEFFMQNGNYGNSTVSKTVAAGYCDHCGRPGDSPMCRNPARHGAALQAQREMIGR